MEYFEIVNILLPNNVSLSGFSIIDRWSCLNQLLHWQLQMVPF